MLKELIGVGPNRLMRIDPDGTLVKKWFMNNMQTWVINWESKQFELTFDNEKVYFLCLNNLNPKVLHEMIGGYIFMSLRTQDTIDNEMFFKLTDKR
jgi:hypothetical protein